jgi:protein-tyrosine-phosphatase
VSFSVLYVCTGNVCRSPTAELLFRAWAAPGADVQVSSAGTHALVDDPVYPPSAAALGELGIDAGSHRARQYEAWMAARADLVLTAERAHRDLILTELPRVLRRTFTMNEFARLATRTSPGAPVDVIRAAADIRGIDGAVAAADDMPDPFRDGIERARAVAEQIVNTVHVTLGALGLAAPATATTTFPARTVPTPRPRPRPSQARP